MLADTADQDRALRCAVAQLLEAELRLQRFPRLAGLVRQRELLAPPADATLPRADVSLCCAALEEIERRYALWAFEKLGRNKSLAAQTLGIDRKTLARKLGDRG